jgi:hypothetical protein
VNARQCGQVLAFFAILMPIVLLPLAAYAIDAAFVSSKAAALQEATAQAGEAAAQQVDVAALRRSSVLTIDEASAIAVSGRQLSLLAPNANLQSVVVSGAQLTITTTEMVDLPFHFLPVAAVRLEARARARLVGGYDSPSSRLPLPINTF